MTAIKRTPIEAAARTAGATLVVEAGWLRATGYPHTGRGDLQLVDETGRGLILIQGRAGGEVLAALGVEEPAAVGAGQRAGDLAVYRLRPDQLLLLTPPGGEAMALAALSDAAGAADQPITVTDLTHGRAVLRLSGAAAAELLSRLCALDFHPAQFPDGAARQTSLAKTAQLIIRDDEGQTPAYYLIGARSLGAYLWGALLDAGRDLGVRPAGSSGR